MTLFGFVLAVCYVPGWSGFTIPTGWVLLSVALPFILLEPIEMSLGHWLGITFLAYAWASLAWTSLWLQGIWSLWLAMMLGAAFCFGAAYKLDNLYVGLAFGIGVSSALAIAQSFGWSPVYLFTGPAGLFVNTSVLGEAAAIVTVALIASRLFWPLIFTIPAVLISGSRTAILALAIAALWGRSYLLIGLCVLIGGYFLVSRPLAGLVERLAIWQGTYDGLTLFGRGAGSFAMEYPRFARTDTYLSRPETPHNEFLNLAFEYGVGALPILGIIALSLSSSDPQRLTVVAFLILSLFAFPSHIPLTGFVGMAAMGHLCRGRCLVWRNGSDRRRSLTDGRYA